MTEQQQASAPAVKRQPSALMIKSYLIGAIWLIATIALIGTAAVLPDDMLRDQFTELMSYTLGGAFLATLIIGIFV